MKDIKDYLHLYLKVWGTVSESAHSLYINGEWALSAAILSEVMLGKMKFAPHLRNLSDITEEEKEYRWNTFCNIREINQEVVAEEIKWLLSKGFDLFGLIESGDALDKTKL